MNDKQRYSRQIQLPQIGNEGQQTLLNSKVLLVGAGGLGCTIGAQLSGAGIGSITVVDHDILELSNLHRQILYRQHHLDQSKAEVAAAELSKINPEITVTAVIERVSANNAASLVTGHDLIIDAADSMVVSYLLSDACQQQNLPLLSASVNQTYGFVGSFCGGNNLPSYRDCFPEFPETINNCDVAGVTGPSVGIIASIQAQEAIKILLNSEHQLNNELLYFNLWNYQINRIKFERSSENLPKIELLTLQQLNINHAIIDVREANEIEANDAYQNIPLSELKNRLDELPEDKRIACLCKSGHRAMVAAQIISRASSKTAAAITPEQ